MSEAVVNLDARLRRLEQLKLEGDDNNTSPSNSMYRNPVKLVGTEPDDEMQSQVRNSNEHVIKHYMKSTVLFSILHGPY